MPARSPHAFSRRSLTAGVAALGAVTLAGFTARAEEEPGASPDASPSTDHPTLLLRMNSGLVSSKPELQLTAVPDFSLYDDGSIYRLGPVIAIYPPPALPNLTRMRVSANAVEIIREQARDAGLDQPNMIRNPTMHDDFPPTNFLFNTGDRIVLSSAWGLFADVDRPPEWDDATYAVWQRLRDFASYLTNLPFNLPNEALLEPEMPIDPERLQIIAFDASPDRPSSSGIPDLDQPAIPWPLSTPLAELAPFDDAVVSGLAGPRCTVVTGADARSVVEASRQGNLLSPWIDGDGTYGVLLTPLLPDQTGCEVVEPA